MLERVNNVCRTVYQANKKVTFKKLVSSVRSEFKKSDIDLIIKVKKDKTLEKDQFYIEGWYDADNDKNDEPPIELLIAHYFDADSIFSENHVTEFLIQVYDAVVHELRHMYQSRKRSYNTYSDHNSDPYSSYLADPDELDAYALSIAIELLRFMDKVRCRQYMKRYTVLSKMKNGPSLVSPNLRSYVQYYKKNPLLKKLIKKVSTHIERLDRNQIFR